MDQQGDAGAGPLAHIGSIIQLVDHARRYAIGPEDLLDQALVEALAEGRAPDYVPASDLIDALESAAHLARNPMFGLESSACADLHGFGPLSKLTGTLTSVSDALRQSERYMHLVNGALATRIERYDDVVRIERVCVLPGSRGNRQLMDGAIVLLVRAMRAILGEDWSPGTIEIGHNDRQGRETYQRMLRAPLVFGSASYAVELPAADFDRIVSVPERTQRLDHDRALASIAHALPDALVTRVRQKVREQLASGALSLAQTAHSLGKAPRSLQRHLREHGSNYGAIVLEQRLAIAHECLASEPRPTLPELTSRLAYEDISVASRFLRAHFGQGLRALNRH